MGKVLRMTGVLHRTVANAHKKTSLLSEALNELKDETGIDFYKVITGDEKENKRLKFKHYQEKLLEG